MLLLLLWWWLIIILFHHHHHHNNNNHHHHHHINPILLLLEVHLGFEFWWTTLQAGSASSPAFLRAILEPCLLVQLVGKPKGGQAPMSPAAGRIWTNSCDEDFLSETVVPSQFQAIKWRVSPGGMPRIPSSTPTSLCPCSSLWHLDLDLGHRTSHWNGKPTDMAALQGLPKLRLLHT